ncbi:glycosyltransferase family 4 protein, partial [candidate division KSB1 bacterium]|nr:glycosyltransferase family 4 protein [candidate division KSB1 bacterium]
KKNDNVILFFGYVRQYKGLHILLQAMPSLLKEMDVKLVVAGEFYDKKENYTSIIDKLNIQDSVSIFDDYIPNEKVGMFYSAADVVVLPYITATQSGIIQIAYNYNKPVITTNVGGLPEVVDEGKTGFTVPPENPDELAQAVLKFFKLNKRDNFSKNVQVYKKRFSWERLAEEIESFDLLLRGWD